MSLQVTQTEENQPVLSDNPAADAAALAAFEASQAAAAAAANPAPVDPPPADPDPVDPPADEEGKAATEAAGLDFDKLGAEYDEKGDLAPESYEALAKIGITEDMVKAYIAGRAAVAEVDTNAVLSTVGGAEKYAEISNWALSNLSAEDLEAYNAAVTNPATAKFAVKALAAQYAAAEGSTPSLIKPSTAATTASGPVPFASSAQVVEAMRDPRYRTDPAYQREVQARLSRSSVF